MKNKIVLIILFSALIVSCRKDRITSSAETKEVSARVVYKGDPAVDGCGWQIISDTGTPFMPENLDAAFKTVNLEIIISFTTVGEFDCSYTHSGNGIPTIHLTGIRKK